MMDGKTGWARTALIERLYPLTGTFEKAKIVFDKYYRKVSCYDMLSFQPTRTSFGGTIWSSWDFTHLKKWSPKASKTSKWCPISEPCCLHKNSTKSRKDMSDGWWAVQSKRKKKSSETSQLHLVMPSRTDSSRSQKITWISARWPRRSLRSCLASMMRRWWRIRISKRPRKRNSSSEIIVWIESSENSNTDVLVKDINFLLNF